MVGLLLLGVLVAVAMRFAWLDSKARMRSGERL